MIYVIIMLIMQHDSYVYPRAIICWPIGTSGI